MKKILVIVLACCVQMACAQQPDDLTLTLPTGKVLTFQSAEQKAKFTAALERKAAAAAGANGAATPAATPKPFASPSANAGGAKTGSSFGVANTSAPMYTADYYLTAPETWVDKPLTLAVAYIDSSTSRDDGNKQLTVYTFNQGKPGGFITIVAPPAVAVNIARLCGGKVQYMSELKTTVVHGTMQRDKGKKKGYYVFVEK